MSGSVTGAAYKVRWHPYLGVQFSWTGTPTGTISLEVSNAASPGASDWTALTISGLVHPSGSAGSHYIELQLSATWIRAVYTRTSGSGTLTARISGKGT